MVDNIINYYSQIFNIETLIFKPYLCLNIKNLAVNKIDLNINNKILNEGLL